METAYSSCIGWTNVKDYNNCLTEVISNLGPELARGISDFNLPPLDPYDCPSLNLKYNLPFFTIRLNISDYQIIDATKYIVQSVNVNPYNLTLNVNVKIPQIVTKLNYNVKGTVLFLNVTGIGKFEGNSSKHSYLKKKKKKLTYKLTKINFSFAADILASITANGKNVTDENNVERVTLDKVKVRLLRISGVKVKMTSSSPKFRSVGKCMIFFCSLFR